VIKAVLDTNVLASGLVVPGGSTTPALLLDAWRARQYLLVVSEPILNELARTLQKPYFAARLFASQVAADLLLLRTDGLLTPITATVQGVATHPEDDLILAAAVSASADYLVTGDRQLQRLGTYQGVQIVSPARFVAVLSCKA
jgi:putative PIN family toxin of toxin-antitoxin system